MALQGGIRTAQQRASCLVGTLFTLPREGAVLGEAGANASWAAICSPPGPSRLWSLRTAAVLRAAVAPREHHSSSLKVSGQASGTPGLRMARGRGGHSLTREEVAAREGVAFLSIKRPHVQPAKLLALSGGERTAGSYVHRPGERSRAETQE